MFEYQAWAVVRSDAGTEEADDALMDGLRQQVAALPEVLRGSFHLGDGTNGMWSFTASGLRNHQRVEVMLVFDWLAAHSRRSYGLLYVRDDAVEDGDRDAFHVYRLTDGRIAVLADPFFS